MDQQQFAFDDLIDRGYLVILVDDVDLSDEKRLSILLEFANQNPKNRFVLTTNAELFDQIGVETTLETAVPFITVYMEPFRRRDMRQLVERWDSEGVGPDKERLLDRLVKDIVHINAPLTPVNGTILLTIFDAHGDFTPINRAVLIQLFIETLLEKHSFHEARRERFDFRNKVYLLSHIACARFNSLGEVLENETGWIKDLNAINELTPPHEEVKTAFFEAIERQLQAPPLTKDERDELLEAEVPRDVGNRQEVFRPLYEDVGEQWTGCLLLYSRVLKSSELVPDYRKREHLSRVLGGWAQLTYHALLLVPALVKDRRLTVNGVAYHVLSPESASDAEVARGLYLALPRSISDMVNFYLATEKMEVQFREPTLDDVNEPLIVKFYRSGLYGDLKLKGFLEVLLDLEAALKPSLYLAEAFIWKLRQMLIRLPLSRREDAEFRKLIALSVSRLLPGSGTERQQRASEEMHRLELGRLLRQLRIQARERAED